MKIAISILLLFQVNLLLCQNFELIASMPADFEIQSGKVNLTFKIDAINWAESQTVTILDGYFQVTLGKNNPLSKSEVSNKSQTIDGDYGNKGLGVMVSTLHNGKLISEIPLFVDGENTPGAAVMMPEIIEVSDEEELEEIEISIDDYDEISEDEIFFEVEEEEDLVFQIVEEMPEFPGGPSALHEFIQNNLKYPNQAKTDGIEGRVYVQFIVRKDGQITDVRVVKGIGAGCDEEAIRLIESIQNFKPGRQRGKAVNVNITQPVNFKL